ncbi:uncharacterized protein LOC135824614 [Sycon ciliatum]|uniref:uncharacterized protein LOC135824614 n=1 Tax=Sycon ciliatum TaxID=27933 RepID=UPI0020AE9C28
MAKPLYVGRAPRCGVKGMKGLKQSSPSSDSAPAPDLSSSMHKMPIKHCLSLPSSSITADGGNRRSSRSSLTSSSSDTRLAPLYDTPSGSMRSSMSDIATEAAGAGGDGEACEAISKRSIHEAATVFRPAVGRGASPQRDGGNSVVQFASDRESMFTSVDGGDVYSVRSTVSSTSILSHTQSSAGVLPSTSGASDIGALSETKKITRNSRGGLSQSLKRSIRKSLRRFSDAL